MDAANRIHLKDLLPEHDRIIPRSHPHLNDHLGELPPAWQTALQDPGDPGQAAARIWQPIKELARGMVFRYGGSLPESETSPRTWGWSFRILASSPHT